MTGKQTGIIHIVENFDERNGGPSVSISVLANRQYEEGLRVKVLSGHYWGDTEKNGMIHSGVYWKRLTQIPLGRLRISLSLWSTLLSEVAPGDVLHFHNLWNFYPLVGFLFARRYHIPYIVSPRGALAPWALGQRRVLKKIGWLLFQKRMLDLAKKIHVTSDLEGNEVATLGIKERKILVAENPVISEECRPDKEPNLVPVFLFLSRIHVKKGVDLLIQAWRAVSDQIPKAKLIFAGPEEDMDLLGRILTLVGEFPGLVEYRGQVASTNKWALLGSVDFLVLPSYSENFGNVVAEALSCGVPVITTTATPWGVLRSEGCGWYIDIAVESLVGALIEACCLSRDKYLEYSARARNVARRYTWESTRDLYLRELYGIDLASPRPRKLS